MLLFGHRGLNGVKVVQERSWKFEMELEMELEEMKFKMKFKTSLKSIHERMVNAR